MRIGPPDAADHHLGLVAKRRDRPVLKIDHEDRRSEERRDDEEYRLRLAIGERRKTLHQPRTLAAVTAAVKQRLPGTGRGHRAGDLKSWRSLGRDCGLAGSTNMGPRSGKLDSTQTPSRIQSRAQSRPGWPPSSALSASPARGRL